MANTKETNATDPWQLIGQTHEVKSDLYKLQRSLPLLEDGADAEAA